ncbi:MAG: glucose-6-phosphate dehydrogenase [Thermodesulfobacteriota bacterium]|nr:MAG: glucose-6-phosphate dehydrogenase [Thermodesulfobacteriota bacterium]
MHNNDKHKPAEPAVEVGRVEPAGPVCSEVYPGSMAMVIYGASGDLTARKLIPALYCLAKSNILPERFFIIGASRSDMGHDGFRKAMEKSVRASGAFDAGVWEAFAKRLYYISVDFKDRASFGKLKELLAEKEAEYATEGNRIFYLATPPSVYGPIIEAIAATGLSTGTGGWTRLVVEKPYGRDLSSARELEKTVHRNFDEEQVYRIDHYLGKETVQNITMLRFANSIFEPVWNRRYIDHIQITAAESIGIEKRAGYYEQAGVLRDMFQNHMLQLLSIATMEPPALYTSELVRDEKVKVMRALRPLPLDRLSDSLVLGQYGAGTEDGEEVPAYRDEANVDASSMTPTFAAMKLYIDNWRWQGVPFYLRSGKRLGKRFSEIKIQFKGVPHGLFQDTLGQGEIGPNALILKIQPDERVQLSFHAKSPGSKLCLRDVMMDFSYTEGYRGLVFNAYERVLMDCMLGDKILFVRNDGVELTWSFLTPVLDFIEGRKPGAPELFFYPAGSFGPEQADTMMSKDGRAWSNNGDG